MVQADLTRNLERQAGGALRRHGYLDHHAQEVWLRVLGALGHLRAGADLEDLRAVLYQHARWAVLRAAERARDFQGESALGPPGSRDPAPQGESSLTGPVTREDSVAWLRERIDALGPELAEVIHLRLEGVEFAEIAARLGISEGAARKRFERGTKRLVE